MAGSIRDRAHLDRLKAVLPMPVRVVRLTVPFPEIERRLQAEVSTGRKDDLRVAAEWLAGSIGEGIEDLTISNERPIREVALQVLDRLRWR